MGRKPGRGRVGASVGPPVRISISLDADVHARLRCLALVRKATCQDIVAALIASAVEGVRLPSIGGPMGVDPNGDGDVAA